jgi:hypothetical protein
MTHDDRLYRLEAKIDHLYRHLGLDPEAALPRAGDFSPQDEFGIPRRTDSPHRPRVDSRLPRRVDSRHRRGTGFRRRSTTR